MHDSDKLGEVRFPIKAAWLTGLAVIGLSLGFYFGTPDLRAAITFFAAASAAGGAVLAAFYSSRSLNISANANVKSAQEAQQAEELRKKENALEFGRRWNDPSLYHVRDVMREVFICTNGDDGVRQCITGKETNIIHFLNFMEEIAVSIEADVVDEALVRAQFEGIATGGWHRLSNWITDHRKVRQRPRIWIKLEAQVKSWC